MENLVTFLALAGALAFGLVMGWVTYGTLRRAERSSLTDLSTILGIIGGAAVLDLFPVESGAFGAYAIGLAMGFFGYLRFATTSKNAPEWLGEGDGRRPQRTGVVRDGDTLPDVAGE